MDQELLTAKEVAEWLQVSVKTLEAWRAKGRGPAWMKAGRGVRYARGAVAAYLGREQTPKAG